MPLPGPLGRSAGIGHVLPNPAFFVASARGHYVRTDARSPAVPCPTRQRLVRPPRHQRLSRPRLRQSHRSLLPLRYSRLRLRLPRRDRLPPHVPRHRPGRALWRSGLHMDGHPPGPQNRQSERHRDAPGPRYTLDHRPRAACPGSRVRRPQSAGPGRSRCRDDDLVHRHGHHDLHGSAETRPLFCRRLAPAGHPPGRSARLTRRRRRPASSA